MIVIRVQIKLMLVDNRFNVLNFIVSFREDSRAECHKYGLGGYASVQGRHAFASNM